MKARQIEKIIYDKVAELAIAHPKIQKELMDHSIVTGGCIASMFLQEKVNDYDIYFDSLEALVKVMEYFGVKTEAKYLVAFNKGKHIPDHGLDKSEYDGETSIPVPKDTSTTMYRVYTEIEHLMYNQNVQYISLFYQSSGSWTPDDEAKKKDEPYMVKFASANAVTLSDKVQLVFRFFGPPEEIHKNYDFVHATNYWTAKTGLVTNTEALEAILAKELIYKGSRFPLASIFRTRKFIQRHWTIHIGNYVKMAMQLNELDLKNIHVLREQLTGVDAAYLNWLIMKCEKADRPITCDYVCELVDQIIRGGQEDTPE